MYYSLFPPIISYFVTKCFRLYGKIKFVRIRFKRNLRVKYYESKFLIQIFIWKMLILNLTRCFKYNQFIPYINGRLIFVNYSLVFYYVLLASILLLNYDIVHKVFQDKNRIRAWKRVCVVKKWSETICSKKMLS